MTKKKLTDIAFIDAATGEIKKVGDLFNEIAELKRKLEEVKQYAIDAQNDEHAMVIEQEMAQDILNILNGVPANTRGEELLKGVNNAK